MKIRYSACFRVSDCDLVAISSGVKNKARWSVITLNNTLFPPATAAGEETHPGGAVGSSDTVCSLLRRTLDVYCNELNNVTLGCTRCRLHARWLWCDRQEDIRVQWGIHRFRKLLLKIPTVCFYIITHIEPSVLIIRPFIMLVCKGPLSKGRPGPWNSSEYWFCPHLNGKCPKNRYNFEYSLMQTFISSLVWVAAWKWGGSFPFSSFRCGSGLLWDLAAECIHVIQSGRYHC